MAEIPCAVSRKAIAMHFRIPYQAYVAAPKSGSKVTLLGDRNASAVFEFCPAGPVKCASCRARIGIKIHLVSFDMSLLDTKDITEPLCECVVRFVAIPNLARNRCENVNEEICLPVRRGNNLDYTDVFVMLKHLYSELTVTVELCFGEMNHPCWFARKNLQGLLFSEDKSDVTFIVEGEQIPAHTLILSVSSVEFNRMFKCGEKNKSTGTVEIFETNPAAFKEMLRFIYTRALPDSQMEDELLFGIMALSEKYALRPLTLQCEGRFLDTMSVSNTCDRLKKVKHICPDFLDAVLKRYVACNIVEIMNSEAWTTLEVEDSQLVIQVMKYCVTRKESEKND